ncbi:hypothetical protein TNCV_1969141 [Trichonephila clavipes]|nr:hypothetical protein TNCV_1969141 [Trichonephila clavipes]
MNPCSVYTIKMAASVFGSVHWSSCYWHITWCDGMGGYWILISVTSCSHGRHFEQCMLYFWCVKTRGSALYFTPVKIYVSERLHDRMLPVLYGPALIRKMFSCYPGLYVLQIFPQ